VIASNARSGPVPLPLGVGVMLGEMVVLSRGWGSARPGLRSQVGGAFGVPQRGTAYQPGVKPRGWRTTGAFCRNAAYPRLSLGAVVTVPPLGVLVARSAGSVLHSQVGLGEDELSRCCARGLGDRLQCSFWPGPAAAGCGCDGGGEGGFESWVGLRETGPALAGKL
jgi:hypothetical protein